MLATMLFRPAAFCMICAFREPFNCKDPQTAFFYTSRPIFRRLMCNELDQQVRKVAQRSAEGVVDALAAGVRGDLRRQTSQQPAEGLGSVTLQSEEILELAYNPFYDLALA